MAALTERTVSFEKNFFILEKISLKVKTNQYTKSYPSASTIGDDADLKLIKP